MPRLVTVDVPALLRHVAAVCAAEPRVAAAYLFGSAQGEMRPDSDVDVAIVPSPAAQSVSGLAAFDLAAALEGALGRWHGHPFEATVLSPHDAVFTMSALREARLAYERDPRAHADFLEAVAQRYRLDAHRYWQALREVNGWDARPTPSA